MALETTCVYRWIASKLGTKSKEEISRVMNTVLNQNEGWTAVGYPVKKPQRTWLGEGQNATFTIQLENLDRPINKMFVMYLKSYGKLWASSRLLLVVEGSKPSYQGGNWKELRKAELDGVHDSPTSINYSHKIDLGDFLQLGSTVRANFTITGGSRFQINGLALCESA